MATELYGVKGQLVESIAQTPVSTDTVLIFIGASASGDLNKAHLITSFADYTTKLGGTLGDGYNLTEAAISAFVVAGLSRVYMIPVSHSKEFNAADYIGSASLDSGVYAIEALLRNQPSAVNIICAPSIDDASVLSALNTIAQNADNHWQSFVLYDVLENDTQINGANIAQVSNIVSAKQLNSERARAVWGHVKTSGGYTVSGAAVQACLLAVSDANYSCPARCGGNLPANDVQSIQITKASDEITSTCDTSTAHPKFTMTQTGYTTYTGKAVCEYTYEISGEQTKVTETVSFTSGIGTMALDLSGLSNPTQIGFSVKIIVSKPVVLKEADATSLSADGICSFIKTGGGNWRTWGDHTSAFSGGTIEDERGRFDNYIRMQMMISNRFQMKYINKIDDPMTLQMRNDVITEEINYLNSLVAIGALIGDPVCDFVPADNTVDDTIQGHFTWQIATTETPPAKYLLAKVAYTQAGLSIYSEEV